MQKYTGSQEGDGMGGGREVQQRGKYAYPWLIHVDVWQKPTLHCKAIILQLKFLKSKETKQLEMTLKLLSSAQLLSHV